MDREDVEELRLLVGLDTDRTVRKILRRVRRLERKLNLIGVTMTALSDAVDALVQRVTEDTDHLQAVILDLTGQLATALANDAADAATIAEKQAELDAVNADAAATVARLQAIDPVSDFPAVETPPVDVPPVEA